MRISISGSMRDTMLKTQWHNRSDIKRIKMRNGEKCFTGLSKLFGITMNMASLFYVWWIFCLCFSLGESMASGNGALFKDSQRYNTGTAWADDWSTPSRASYSVMDCATECLKTTRCASLKLPHGGALLWNQLPNPKRDFRSTRERRHLELQRETGLRYGNQS